MRTVRRANCGNDSTRSILCHRKYYWRDAIFSAGIASNQIDFSSWFLFAIFTWEINHFPISLLFHSLAPHPERRNGLHVFVIFSLDDWRNCTIHIVVECARVENKVLVKIVMIYISLARIKIYILHAVPERLRLGFFPLFYFYTFFIFILFWMKVIRGRKCQLIKQHRCGVGYV